MNDREKLMGLTYIVIIGIMWVQHLILCLN